MQDSGLNILIAVVWGIIELRQLYLRRFVWIFYSWFLRRCCIFTVLTYMNIWGASSVLLLQLIFIIIWICIFFQREFVFIIIERGFLRHFIILHILVFIVLRNINLRHLVIGRLVNFLILSRRLSLELWALFSFDLRGLLFAAGTSFLLFRTAHFIFILSL